MEKKSLKKSSLKEMIKLKTKNKQNGFVQYMFPILHWRRHCNGHLEPRHSSHLTDLTESNVNKRQRHGHSTSSISSSGISFAHPFSHLFSPSSSHVSSSPTPTPPSSHLSITSSHLSTTTPPSSHFSTTTSSPPQLHLHQAPQISTDQW